MSIPKYIEKLKIEIDKDLLFKRTKELIDRLEKKSPEYFTGFHIPFVPINLYLDDAKYMPNNEPDEPSTFDRFFPSIPHKKEFSLICKKEKYQLIMFDGVFDLILYFDNTHNVKVEISLFTEDEPIYTTMEANDLFQQFDQMWVDLLDVLYQIYPRELVDKEVGKIYSEIDERVKQGKV